MIRPKTITFLSVLIDQFELNAVTMIVQPSCLYCETYMLVLRVLMVIGTSTLYPAIILLHGIFDSAVVACMDHMCNTY